jgi:Zn-dependent peptidase ImmA (M78 family)
MAAPQERAASEMLARHRMQGNVPLDVEAMATSAGIVVLRQVMDQNVSGALLRDGESVLLSINQGHSPTRQRFTIAHELGHFALHPGRQYTVDSTIRVNWRNDLSSLATDREEIEANAFAAALLMPSDAVRREAIHLTEKPASEWNLFGQGLAGITSALAEKFEVSTEAMGYRLVNLGIST